MGWLLPKNSEDIDKNDDIDSPAACRGQAAI
jgi:hypothetical protein